MDKELNRPVWDVAADAGMRYLSYIGSDERDEELANCRLLVDTSWSEKHERLGCHFNRVFVEAMDAGAMPLVTRSAMRGSGLFEENENYIAYDHEISPAEFGALIDDVAEDVTRLQEIQAASLEAVGQFAAEKVAAKVVEASELYARGRPTLRVVDAARRNLAQFYP